jgi:hypothetical protein
MDEVTCSGWNHPIADEVLSMWQMKVVVPGISFCFPDGDKSRPERITVS